MEIAIMIEGQNGVNWENWQRVALAVEELGFVGLYRSDHFTNMNAPDLDSLELWTSLTWLATHTRRIEFGNLVSPVSFRHPVWLARTGKDLDALSGGRFTLGVGAGWQPREHDMFGFDLLDVPDRLDRFEEGLHIISRLLWKDEQERSTYEGKYFHIHDAVLLPKPHALGRPALLVGGTGMQRTLPLAAQFADEWNGNFLTPERFAKRNLRLNDLMRMEERDPAAIRRSVMVGLRFGKDQTALDANTLYSGAVDELREHGIVAGTPSEVVDRLGEYAEAGVQRIMLQWLDLDDMDGLEAFAQAVL